MTRTPLLLLCVAALASLSSCNIYSFMDSPGGDAELISAARAALDRGDFEKAKEYYEELSADNNDIKYSEEAFTVLTQYNVGMATIAGAFGTGSSADTGKAITIIANAIGSQKGAATRLVLFHAFQNSLKITDANLKGLTRFLTSLAFLGELLAEGAADPTHLLASDLALTPTTCKTAANDTSPPTCGTTNTAACARPSASKLLSGPTTVLDLTATTTTDAMIGDTADPATTAPTLSLIKSAIDQINAGLHDLGSSGSLSSSVGGFTGAFAAALFTGDAPCFRATLLQYNIGTY